MPNNKENKVEIELPNGYKLVAEQNTGSDYPYEMYVGIVAPGGGWIQDLVTVRNSYKHNEDREVEWSDDSFDVFVFGNKDDEDYTEEFQIGLWKGCE